MLWLASTLPARCRALPTISSTSVSFPLDVETAGLEPRRVQQIRDKAVEPLRFLLDRRYQLIARRLAVIVAVDLQAAGGAEDRRQRCSQVVRHGDEQRRSQTFRLRRDARLVDVLGETNALDRDRGLVQQRLQQAPFVRREQRAGHFAVDADHADHAARRTQRQEETPSARKRIRTPAGRPIVLPAPLGRREVRCVELVLRREAGADGDAILLRQQDDHVHLQHRGDLVRRCPEEIVHVDDACELLTEAVQLGGNLRPAAGDEHLGPGLGGEIADEDGDGQKEGEGHDVLGVGDRQPINRWQKEEIEGQRGNRTGEQRGRQTEPRRDERDCADEDEREIADVEKLPEGKADRGGADHGSERNDVREQMHLLLLRSVARRCGRRRLFVLPGHDQNADVSGATDQVVHHRPVQHLEPARTARLADDDVRDVVALCVSDDVVHDVRARYRECHPAQLVSEPQAGGDPVAFAIAQPMMTSGLDIERRPRRVQRVREPPGVPDEAQRSRVFANADEHARARRPWTADGVRLHMRKQLVVDALRRPPQGQLAKGGQVSR